MVASRQVLFLILIAFIPSLAWANICDSYLNCQHQFTIKKNYLTYFSTHNINNIDPKIKRLVIVIHGALRNGHEYFDDTVIASKKFGVSSSTLVLAPTFRKVTDERQASDDIEEGPMAITVNNRIKIK